MGRVLPLLIALLWSSFAQALTCPTGQQPVYQAANNYVSPPACSAYASNHSSPDAAASSCAASGHTSLSQMQCQYPGSDPYTTYPTWGGIRKSTNNTTGVGNWDQQMNYPQCGNQAAYSIWNSNVIYVREVCGTLPPPPPPPECQSKSGNMKAMTADASTSANYNVCFEGCQMEVLVEGLRISRPGMTSSQIGVQGKWSGQACQSEAPGQQGVSKKLADGTDGACTSDGGYCISQQKKNCGYVNGEYRCITSSQLTDQNPCVTTASGAQFCKGSAGTPPQPDNGTPGQPTVPDGEFRIQDPATAEYTTVNYFSSSTVNNSSTAPGNDDSSDQDSDGVPDGGEGECGSDGEQPCKVKVDETGMPDAEEPGLPAELDGKISELENVGKNSPLSGYSPSIPTLQSGSCRTITINFFRGISKQFPPPVLCNFLDDIFKPALAYLFYFFTFVSIVAAVLASNGGKA